MKVRPFLARKLRALAMYLEQPHLLKLRRRGVALDCYLPLQLPWLRTLPIATVLDVGANIGQFAQAAHEVWPAAHIYSFEPLPDCYEQLRSRMRSAANFTAFNVGLGEKAGTLTFQRSCWSASSSFLKMAVRHRTEYPHTQACQETTVRVERLDDMVANLPLRRPMLLKIDVQGYEEQVLKGGESTLRSADYVILEASFVELYEGQPLFDDLYRAMTSQGFDCRGALEQARSEKDGRPLQADILFARRNAA